MHRNPFSDAELEQRLIRIRDALAARSLDGAILSTPENIFYLTGLDHWGYFAPHMLVVTLDRRPVLMTREMERVSVENMVCNADFRGHADAETVADVAARAIADLSLAGSRIGLETWSAGLSHGLARSLMAKVDASWVDITGVVDRLREVKSDEEQALIRRAAAATNAGTEAAIAAVGDGALEREVAAACIAAMTLAGGEPPGFGPFIRPGCRLGEEHTTWGSGSYRQGDKVMLEIAGCVARYHTPNGRLLHVGPVPDGDRAVAETGTLAYQELLRALRPSARWGDVYAAWQAVVDDAGLSHYRRHHCGYLVGISFPPTWTGGNAVVGLRPDSDLEILPGMTFHAMSWLVGCGRGDSFLSNCVLLTEAGVEVLTTAPLMPDGTSRDARY